MNDYVKAIIRIVSISARNFYIIELRSNLGVYIWASA